MKALKLSEYYKIVNPEYIFLRLIPHTDSKGYDSSKIAKTIAGLYKSLSQRIQRIDKKCIINKPSKVGYYIYIEKNRVEFYFIIPKQYLSLLKTKITDTWKSITIKQVDGIPVVNDGIKFQLTYKKEDALSCSTSKENSTLLASILNVTNVLQDGNKIGILYNFIPCNTFTWRANYDRTIQKVEEKFPIDRQKINAFYMIKCVAMVLYSAAYSILNALNNVLSDEKAVPFMDDLTRQFKMELSPATKKKRDNTILNAQIIVTATNRENAISVCDSYKTISEDNELIYKPIKTNHSITDYSVSNDMLMMSADECQNLISLPNKSMMEEYNMIESVNVHEDRVPKELQSGVMCIGETTCKGETQKAYLSTDKEMKNLTLVICGATRSGKTTLIENLCKDASDNKETTIIFDFCGNGELSNNVSRVINGKILNIDCGNLNELQGLGYNEIVPLSNNALEVYRCAKAKTVQLMTLINSINENDSDLKARMERYLEAAAVITFLNNGSIKDVFSVLQSYKMRTHYINSISEFQKNNVQDYILALAELDDVDKKTCEVVGTRISSVQGILNRISRLKQNTYMELMLKKSCEHNINLVDEMQRPQLITIRMPEIMFSTEQEKDIYCTYWLTKIWGALQQRKWKYEDAKDRVKVNLVIDELYQVPQCQEFLRSKLSQIAKFSCKPIISCHYLGQIPIIRDELKSANSSYMLLNGADKDNFKELKDELKPYELEDLLNLKRFHSLNLIKYEKGWARFVTKMPKPVKERDL